MRVTVHNCQRCGHDHAGMDFRPLPNPADEWKYWAVCPETQCPVLLRVEDDGAAAGKVEDFLDTFGTFTQVISKESLGTVIGPNNVYWLYERFAAAWKEHFGEEVPAPEAKP